jgi:hypothetical protein
MAADADARIEPWPTRPSRVAMTESILVQLDNADFRAEILRTRVFVETVGPSIRDTSGSTRESDGRDRRFDEQPSPRRRSGEIR